MSIFARIRYFRDHSFVRNVATLQAGTFLGNFIQAVAGIFLARWLQPENYGLYALSFGLAAVLSIILGAGMQDAMASTIGAAHARSDRQEITDGFAFLLKMAVITGLIVCVILPFLGIISKHFYNNTEIGFYAAIIVAGSIISMFFFSFVQIALQVNHWIKTLTVISVLDQLIRFAFSLVLVFMGFGVLGAVLGQLLGSLVILIISLFIWHKLVTTHVVPHALVLIKEAWRVKLSKFFGFSFWVALDRNISTLYMSLPVMLTGIYVAATQVSYFKLAFGFVNLALSMLGPISVLLNVEFPKMKIEELPKLRDNFIKVSWYSLGLSVLLTLVAIVISPVAFRILYGETFLPSVTYVYGMVIYGGLFGIGVGLGPMWRAINYVKTSIAINLIVLSLGIPLGGLLIKAWGLWGSVAMVTIWFTVSHFVSFLYILRKIKTIEKKSYGV